MAVARRIPPGTLATPAEMGAVSVPVCRLSGLRAAGSCARLTEWFVPGTAPSRDDDWEHDGRVTLPEEYASWASQEMGSAMEGVSLASVRQGTRAAYDTAARRVQRHPVAARPGNPPLPGGVGEWRGRRGARRRRALTAVPPVRRIGPGPILEPWHD